MSFSLQLEDPCPQCCLYSLLEGQSENSWPLGWKYTTISNPKSLKVKCQAFPHDGPTGLKWPVPASLPVTDNHHRAGAKGVTGCGSEVWEFLGWHRGYLLCLDLLLLRLLPQNLYHFRCCKENNTKIHLSTWMDRYFLTSFWWSLSILLCYRIEIFPCLWNLVAISVLIEDALKFSLEGKIFLPVTKLLNGRGHLWMSDQKTLRYQVVLMENPCLTISPCEVLNPATLCLLPRALPFYYCLETLDHWTISQEGLSEDLLDNPEKIWYTDGSSFVLDGIRRAE